MINKENDMEKIRLQKYLADAGIMSRRAAEEEIKNGNVKPKKEKSASLFRHSCGKRLFSAKNYGIIRTTLARIPVFS